MQEALRNAKNSIRYQLFQIELLYIRREQSVVELD